VVEVSSGFVEGSCDGSNIAAMEGGTLTCK